MLARLSLSIFLLAAVAPAANPSPPLEATEPVLVSEGLTGFSLVEPHLATHPVNAEILTAVAIAVPILEDGLGEPRSVAFTSSDGGESWHAVDAPGCGTDPWVAYSPEGRLHLSCHEQREVDGDLVTAIRLLRSEGEPPQWEAPVSVPLGRGGSVDQPKLVIDHSSAGSRGAIYLAAGQYHPVRGSSRYAFGTAVWSSPDGSAFSAPVFVEHDHLDQQPFGSVVFANGDLGVAFMDYATPEPRLVDHRRTWFVVSSDGGTSFSLPTMIDEQQGTELPWAIAVDRSSRFQDRLYVVLDGHWTRDARPPSAEAYKFPLSLIASDDRGLTWSRPVPISRGPATSNAEVPAIAVSEDGTVGVTWYDTREDPDNRCFDVYFAASFDGGQTFQKELRLTPQTSCPADDPRQESVARRWPFGGDYSGLAVTRDGTFQALWADARGGLYRLWTLRISF